MRGASWWEIGIPGLKLNLSYDPFFVLQSKEQNISNQVIIFFCSHKK